MAGQKWKEVAENINTYEGFQKNPRDQRSVREHFHKLITCRLQSKNEKIGSVKWNISKSTYSDRGNPGGNY